MQITVIQSQSFAQSFAEQKHVEEHNNKNKADVNWIINPFSRTLFHH